MEEFKEFTTDDDFTIYGTLNWKDDSAKDKLIIFVHGLSGNQHEHQYFNAVPFFNAIGYDTFRFDFYSNASDSRPSSVSSVSTHADDLNLIINRFRNRYRDIYLIGHSIGCLAIMNAETRSVKKIIYWDPTNGMESLDEKRGEYMAEKDVCILHWGYESLISNKMIDEWMEAYDVKEYSKRIKGDCAFIFAGNAGKDKAWIPYIERFEHVIIEGATHRFTEEGTLKRLYEETLRLIEKSGK